MAEPSEDDPTRLETIIGFAGIAGIYVVLTLLAKWLFPTVGGFMEGLGILLLWFIFLAVIVFFGIQLVLKVLPDDLRTPDRPAEDLLDEVKKLREELKQRDEGAEGDER